MLLLSGKLISGTQIYCFVLHSCLSSFPRYSSLPLFQYLHSSDSFYNPTFAWMPSKKKFKTPLLSLVYKQLWRACLDLPLIVDMTETLMSIILDWHGDCQVTELHRFCFYLYALLYFRNDTCIYAFLSDVFNCFPFSLLSTKTKAIL